MGVTATQDSTSEWREVRAQVTFPWPVRNRATFLRRNLPQALSLPDRPRDQPPPQRSKLYRDDEPIASLTAPMQIAAMPVAVKPRSREAVRRRRRA